MAVHEIVTATSTEEESLSLLLKLEDYLEFEHVFTVFKVFHRISHACVVDASVSMSLPSLTNSRTRFLLGK
jgi:hypothetical protein